MAEKQDLKNDIKIQGEVVRKLKQDGADKDTVSCGSFWNGLLIENDADLANHMGKLGELQMSDMALNQIYPIGLCS